MNTHGRHDAVGELEQRAEWLELARRQSQKLARSRGQFVPSFRWESESGGPAKAAELRPRFSWALALLPLLLLGGATGTWAFVHHLKVEARRVQVEQLMTRQVVPVGAAATPRRVGARAGTPELPRVEEAALPEPEPPPAKARVRKPQRAKKARPERAATAPEASEEPPPAVASKKPQRVIFGTSDAPGEGVIIVPPPVKMRPLFTPESYKKNGRRDAHW